MQYEYKSLLLDDGALDGSCAVLTKTLNREGKSGWEAVCALSQQGLGSSRYNLLGVTQRNVLLLKRQRSASPQATP